MSEPTKDPIEGFQIVGYDPQTKTLKIAVHPLIHESAVQEDALVIKAIEIIEAGPSVNSVEFVPRDKK